MDHQTADKVLANYVQKMGSGLGPLFRALSNELVWLHWRWSQFRILFGEEPSHIDLLNQSAPFFFTVVHDSLFEVTLLGIARIVASENSIGKPNLTIKRFPGLIAALDLRAEIESAIEYAESCARFAIEWRNRHIAHRDLNLALNTSLRPLPEASREKVETALAALRCVLDRIESAYCNSTTAYTSSSPSPWGARTLLHLIQEGLVRQKEIQERLRNSLRELPGVSAEERS